MTRLRWFYGNLSYTVGRQGLNLAAGVLLIAVLGRALGPGGFGAYSIAVLTATLTSTFLNLGVPSSNVYFIGRGDVDLKTALRTTLALWLLFTAAGYAIYLTVFRLTGVSALLDVPKPVLLSGFVVFPPLLLNTFGQSLLQGRRDFRSLNAVALVPPIGTAVAVLIAVWIHGLTISVAIGLTALAQTAAALWGLAILLRTIGAERPSRRGPYLRRALSYAWRAHIGNVAAFANYRIDVFLVSGILGAAATGTYVVAVQVVERLWLLSQSVGVILLPQLAEDYKGEPARGAKLLAHATMLVAGLALVAAALLAILGRPILSLLLGAAFSAAYTPLLLLLPGVVAGAIGKTLSNHFAARGLPGVNTMIGIAVLAANVPVTYVATLHWGVRGAAAATSLLYGLDMLVKFVLVRIDQRTRLETAGSTT